MPQNFLPVGLVDHRLLLDLLLGAAERVDFADQLAIGLQHL
jgi:hypothetical protein